MACSELKRWTEAVRALERSIELNPDFAWSYYHLGYALAQLSEWEKSSSAYRQFLKLEPNAYGYERLGDTLIEQSQSPIQSDRFLLAEATQCYYRAIEVNPDYIRPYYKIMELESHNPEIYFLLAEANARQEEWATATIFYQMGLQIKSDYPEVHFELGIVLEQQNQLEQAIASYQSAISLNPKQTKYSHYLQQALTKRSDHQAQHGEK